MLKRDEKLCAISIFAIGAGKKCEIQDSKQVSLNR
jgi:hypothetical protein